MTKQIFRNLKYTLDRNNCNNYLENPIQMNLFSWKNLKIKREAKSESEEIFRLAVSPLNEVFAQRFET